MIQKGLLIPPNLCVRVGLPQIASLSLLLIFLAQCAWFIARVPLDEIESSYVEEGLLRIDRLSNANSPERSPLVELLAGGPAKVFGTEQHFIRLNDYRWAIRMPFLFAGVMLGASLWYVARRPLRQPGRLHSAGVVCVFATHDHPLRASADPRSGARGAFGLIFTSIAVAHTLYAPREVVLWNWRRILMLGLSIAICVGAQFSLWVVLIPALAFMLWVGHIRRGAALVIFAAACLVGLILLLPLYGFNPVECFHALAAANWFDLSLRQMSSKTAYWLMGTFLLRNGPGPLLLIIVSIAVFLGWKHTRYFGTAAPLIVAVFLLVCTVAMQHYAGTTFLLVALPFLMLFAAGVSARHARKQVGAVFGKRFDCRSLDCQCWCLACTGCWHLPTEVEPGGNFPASNGP